MDGKSPYVGIAAKQDEEIKMEQKTTFLLTGTELFSQGALDNVALDNGVLVIEHVAGRYMQYGAYTSQELALPAFCNLNVSWNADIPANTLIEVQARVLTSSGWSGWLSFGKWAPDYPGKSEAQESDGVFTDGETITVGVQGGGKAVQVKAALFTNDEKSTPALRLVAVSVRPLAWEKQQGILLNQALYLPEYRIASHPTVFGDSMELPIVLTELINRFGADALPEEVAYGMVDGANSLCGNAAYGAAFMGCCGHECYQSWMDLKDLRSEIRNSCAVAVQLEEGVGAANQTIRWVALHGFVHDEMMSVERVLVGNPLAEQEDEIACSMTLGAFVRSFTGRAIVMRAKPRGVRRQRPKRLPCYLKKDKHEGAQAGAFCFYQRGEAFPLPEDFNGWIGCAIKDEIAHATTAKKTFYTLRKSANQGVLFPPELMVEGQRYNIYAVDENTITRTAQITIPALIDRKTVEDR
ncbi:MAG: hypothetical protein R3Y06_01515 [Faecalibacterium sp.]